MGAFNCDISAAVSRGLVLLVAGLVLLVDYDQAQPSDRCKDRGARTHGDPALPSVQQTPGIGTLALKAAGPVLLGGKQFPDRLTGVIGLLGPALLAALVAIGTFADGQRLVLDGRVLGVGAAAAAIRFRAPVLVVVIVAAAVTATARVIAG